ncbi:MAG: hypothetical protein AAFX54_17865 [Pseudomonadota bacterium]
MIAQKLALIVGGAVLVAAMPLGGCARAEGFTGEEFLKWERASQDSLIQISITMTGIVATQGRKDISRCIDDWYSDNENLQTQRHEEILQTIRENPEFHPQGVVLAVIQQQCGSFEESPR